MDAFIADILDIPPGAALPQGIVEGGQVHLDRLMASPALLSNLAFCEAWRSVFGAYPTRVDFWDFRSRTGAQALAECLVERTPLRVIPRAQELVAAAQDAMQKASAALSSGGQARVHAVLVQKLVDRFGLPGAAAPPAADHLLADYAALVCGAAHSSLAAFEAWAGLQPGAEAPGSAAAFYRRSGDAIKALRLLDASPFSGCTLAHCVTGAEQGAPPPTLSCNEALRLAVMRDGYMWRQDSGGAILLLPPDAPSPGAGFAFRTARVPPRLAGLAVPPAMYGRVVAFLDDADARPRLPPPADVVPMVAAKDSGSPAWGAGRLLAVGGSPDDAAARPGVYWLPGAATSWPGGEAPAWAEPLHAAMLSAHMVHRCPLTADGNPAADGVLLLHQFVARYLAARSLHRRVFHEVRPAPAAFGEVVVIDSRPNVWSVLSVLVTLDNLDAAAWGVTVFCSSRARGFYERCLLPHVPAARVEVLEEMDGPSFDVEAYNRLLKSEAFWARIQSPRALLVQDDGMVVRPGLEGPAAGLAQYAYVGARWVRAAFNAELEREVGPDLVGNGGLSMRSVAAMRRVCVEHADAGRRLFNGRLQPVPEDVFFASALARTPGAERCPAEAADRFAMEEVHAPGALGFHKPWPYLPLPAVQAYFAAVLAEARAR